MCRGIMSDDTGESQSLNYPAKQPLSEDARMEKKLSDLRQMFPGKKFQVVGDSGSKRVEVVLDF